VYVLSLLLCRDTGMAAILCHAAGGLRGGETRGAKR